jgi:hypothetical protein
LGTLPPGKELSEIYFTIIEGVSAKSASINFKNSLPRVITNHNQVTFPCPEIPYFVKKILSLLYQEIIKIFN